MNHTGHDMPQLPPGWGVKKLPTREIAYIDDKGEIALARPYDSVIGRQMAWMIYESQESDTNAN